MHLKVDLQLPSGPNSLLGTLLALHLASQLRVPYHGLLGGETWLCGLRGSLYPAL